MTTLDTPTLSELAEKYGTDKGTHGHGYTEYYPTYFEALRHEPITMLEIGVAFGCSLRMWEEYFTNGKICGLDIDPECKRYSGERKHVFTGSQTNGPYLIGLTLSPWDILIDDGSHQWAHQIKTFKIGWPLVKPGGYYVVEDLGTSYSFLWGRRVRPGTTWKDVLALRPPSSFFKGLVDKMHMGWNDIEFIHFYRELCVIKKKL